ncbi:MAG: CvpA family protein [Chloroflexota bacterium]
MNLTTSLLDPVTRQMIQDVHWLDLAILATLAILALRAASRGLLRELGGTAGLLAGVALGGRHAIALADFIATRTGPIPLLDDLCRVATIAVCVWAGGTIGSLMRRTLPIPGIGASDRLGGLAFGAIEGVSAAGFTLSLAQRLGLLAVERQPGGSQLAPLVLAWWTTLQTSIPVAWTAPGLT